MAGIKQANIVILLRGKIVTFATAQEKRKKLYYSNIATHEISNSEIASHHIFNPTHLQALLESFAISKNRTNHHLIIVIAYDGKRLNSFELLQTIICFSKGKFIIDYLFQPSQEIPPLLDPETKNSSSYTFWQDLLKNHNMLEQFLRTGYHQTGMILMSFIIIFVAVMSSSYTTYHSNQLVLQNNDQRANILSKTIQGLQGQIKELHTIEKQNNEIDSKISTLEAVNGKQNNPQSLLLTVAHAMPNQSRLTSLHIGKPKQSITNNPKSKRSLVAHNDTKRKRGTINQQHSPFILKGVTFDPEEISLLVKKLSETFPNTNFSLNHLKPTKLAKSSDTEPEFAFTIRVTKS